MQNSLLSFIFAFDGRERIFFILTLVDVLFVSDDSDDVAFTEAKQSRLTRDVVGHRSYILKRLLYNKKRHTQFRDINIKNQENTQMHITKNSVH